MKTERLFHQDLAVLLSALPTKEPHITHNRRADPKCPVGASASRPRLTHLRPPWVCIGYLKLRQRRCVQGHGYGRDRNGHNRDAVGDACSILTHGSSCVATMGFIPESRWDSGQCTAKRLKIAQPTAGDVVKGLVEGG